MKTALDVRTHVCVSIFTRRCYGSRWEPPSLVEVPKNLNSPPEK